MKRILPLALALTLSLAHAQDDKGTIKHVQAKPTASNAPVTHAEATTVLTRLRTILFDVLHEPGVKKVPLDFNSDPSPVTRDQIIIFMDRLVEAIKPSYKISFPGLPITQAALVTKNPNVREAMVRLVKGGYVNRVDVLLCGPAETVTPQFFGDDIGYFLLRVAELSHLPSSKWSPYLQKP